MRFESTERALAALRSDSSAERREAIQYLSVSRDPAVTENVTRLLTAEIRTPSYALPTATPQKKGRKRSKEEEEDERFAQLEGLGEIVEPTLALATAVADVLGSRYGDQAETELLSLWRTHPAGRVRRHAGQALLNQATAAGIQALEEVFQHSFFETLDPNLCSDRLFAEDLGSRKYGLDRARDELVALGTCAVLRQAADAAFEWLARYFEDPEITDEPGVQRALSILRALLAQMGRVIEPPTRPWLWEMFPLPYPRPILDNRWISLWAKLLSLRPFVKIGAALLELSPDPRAAESLLKAAENGNETPQIWEIVDAIGRQRVSAAVPVLLRLLEAKFDGGTIRSILSALRSIDDVSVVPVLRDRAARADTPWQERDVLPELISYLSRDRAADRAAPPPAGRTEEKKSWWPWGRDKKANGLELLPIPSAGDTTLAAVREIWQRIERWLETNAPRVLKALAAPASEAEIAKAEEELGYRFPADFRTSLGIHDGERKDVGSIKGLRLNSLEEMLSDWRVMEKLLGDGTFSEFADDLGPTGLKPGHWNRGWVPIASDGGGNSYSMDLDPGDAGTAGQIFFFDHEQGPETVEATSFLEWLRHYADELEAGKVRARAGSLAPIEDEE